MQTAREVPFFFSCGDKFAENFMTRSL